MIAALLLGIARVPHETIAADYGLTDLFLKDPKRDHNNPDPMFIPGQVPSMCCNLLLCYSKTLL